MVSLFAMIFLHFQYVILKHIEMTLLFIYYIKITLYENNRNGPRTQCKGSRYKKIIMNELSII